MFRLWSYSRASSVRLKVVPKVLHLTLFLTSRENGRPYMLSHGKLFIHLHDDLTHALQGRFAGNIIDDQFVPWLLTMLGQDVLYGTSSYSSQRSNPIFYRLHSYCTGEPTHLSSIVTAYAFSAMIAWRIWQAGSCTKRFGGPRISVDF